MPKEAPPQEGPQLMIELTGPNSVNVIGPIGQKHLCFGMLEMAKMSIEEHHRNLGQATEDASRRVVPPSDGELETMREESRRRGS